MKITQCTKIIYQCKLCGFKTEGYFSSISRDEWKRYFHLSSHKKFFKLKGIPPDEWLEYFPVVKVFPIKE